MNDVFRSKEMVEKYLKNMDPTYLDDLDIGKPMGRYWRWVKNEFPYDNIAEKHYILVLGRMAPSMADLTPREFRSLCSVWEKLSETFDSILLNSPGTQSIPKRLHFHLIKWKSRTAPKKA